MFHLLDSDKWERQKHFEYYMQMICGKSVPAGQKMWIKVLSSIYLLRRESH